MFEQTLLPINTNNRKRLTVLLSLLMQIGVLAALTVFPLVYTNVLPGAQLRSIIETPAPLPAALPKPIATAQPASQSSAPPRSIPSPIPPTPSPAPPSDPLTPPSDPPGDSVASVALPTLTLPSAPPVPPPTPKPIATHTPPVHHDLTPADLIRKVQPVYPTPARNIHLQGTVEFTAVISKNGDIENLQLLHGHPLLVNAAREAILQWKYRPTILNGQPVEVITTITVNFTLSQ